MLTAVGIWMDGHQPLDTSDGLVVHMKPAFFALLVYSALI